MAAPPGVWDQLSISSKQALRWAGAAARAREEQHGGAPLSAVVDESDLLVGILLAHPRDSEPRMLLEHVGATAADLLPADYPMPSEAGLERHILGVPASDAPELSSEVQNLLATAQSTSAGPSGVTELRDLFGALLKSSSSSVGQAIAALLTRTGLSGLHGTYAQYVSMAPSTGFAEFLAKNHPYTADPVEIPTYKADHAAGSIGDDYIDIRAEVDAFAYLLASRGLQPPLAVGLFGHWGSGKTFFMDAVRSRINQLVSSDAVAQHPQSEVPFWKRVIQIEFNAWHYVDGDLWASLVEHVFSELRAHDEEEPTAVAKRQKFWLSQIDEKLRTRGDVVLASEEKRKALERANGQLVEAETKRTAKEAALEAAELKAAHPTLSTSLNVVQPAIKGLVTASIGDSADDALTAIDDARAELTRGIGFLHGLQWSAPNTYLSIAAVAVVPFVVWLLGQVASLPAVTQVFSGISALLVTVTGVLRGATRQVKSRLDQLDSAAQTVHEEVEEQRQQLLAEVAAARERAAQAQAEVDDLAHQTTRLDAEIAKLEQTVAGVTSGALLSEFVNERVVSHDYRRRLGTAALVQRDFRALSDLIEQQNTEFVKADDGRKPPDPQVLNRIILYIDDLDRCEAERVVAVLQAVHLLLAFPLFVVVVAVDDRWLSHSLVEHYPGVNAADYLEKIFQVPFWIEPLASTARSSIVRGLLQSNVVGTALGDDPSPVDKLEFDDDQRSLLTTMFTHGTVMRLKTAAMSVTPSEFRFLDELGPLLGTTPRSVKRFVNVYQLLCALPPVPAAPGAPPYEELVGFMLAITDSLPRVARYLRDRLGSSTTLAVAMGYGSIEVDPDDRAKYLTWMASRPGWDDFPLECLRVPAERVRRFTFGGDNPLPPSPSSER